MSDVSRPIVGDYGPDAAPFWRASKERRFEVLRCTGCGDVVWYPRAHCPGCGSRELRWAPLPEPVTGVVYTFTVVRKHTHPFFAGRTPYAVAWVDVDDGPRMLSEIVDCDVEQLRIGDRVELRWEEHDALNLPTFTPRP
jgi:uncharacterized protein